MVRRDSTYYLLGIKDLDQAAMNRPGCHPTRPGPENQAIQLVRISVMVW
jgi:hypothetical protein